MRTRDELVSLDQLTDGRAAVHISQVGVVNLAMGLTEKHIL